MAELRWQIRSLPAWTDPETANRRGAHLFRASWDDTLKLLLDEIDRIGGQYPVVLQLLCDDSDIRVDGMLRKQANVRHPGVVVSFQTENLGPLRYATDAYDQQYYGGLTGWQANIRAVALSLQALRAVDRYGVTKRGEQYVGWRAIAAPAPTFSSAGEAFRWMRKYAADELGLIVIEGELTPRKLYRAMAMKMHPDQGHPRADWDRLDEARRMLTEAGRM